MLYISTGTIFNVPREQFDDSIAVIRGGHTLDGIFVTGSARTVRVSDGL